MGSLSINATNSNVSSAQIREFMTTHTAAEVAKAAEKLGVGLKQISSATGQSVDYLKRAATNLGYAVSGSSAALGESSSAGAINAGSTQLRTGLADKDNQIQEAERRALTAESKLSGTQKELAETKEKLANAEQEVAALRAGNAASAPGDASAGSALLHRTQGGQTVGTGGSSHDVRSNAAVEGMVQLNEGVTQKTEQGYQKMVEANAKLQLMAAQANVIMNSDSGLAQATSNMGRNFRDIARG